MDDPSFTGYNFHHMEGCHELKSSDRELSQGHICLNPLCCTWFDLTSWFGFSSNSLDQVEFSKYFTDIAHNGQGIYERLVVIGGRTLELFSETFFMDDYVKNEGAINAKLPHDIKSSTNRSLKRLLYMQKRIERVIANDSLLLFARNYLASVQFSPTAKKVVKSVKAFIGYATQSMHCKDLYYWMPTLIRHIWWIQKYSKRSKFADSNEDHDLLQDLHEYLGYKYDCIIPRIRECLTGSKPDPIRAEVLTGQELLKIFASEYFKALYKEANVVNGRRSIWVDEEVGHFFSSSAIKLFACFFLSFDHYLKQENNEFASSDCFSVTFLSILSTCWVVSTEHESKIWMAALFQRLRQIQLASYLYTSSNTKFHTMSKDSSLIESIGTKKFKFMEHLFKTPYRKGSTLCKFNLFDHIGCSLSSLSKCEVESGNLSLKTAVEADDRSIISPTFCDHKKFFRNSSLAHLCCDASPDNLSQNVDLAPFEFLSQREKPDIFEFSIRCTVDENHRSKAEIALSGDGYQPLPFQRIMEGDSDFKAILLDRNSSEESRIQLEFYKEKDHPKPFLCAKSPNSIVNTVDTSVQTFEELKGDLKSQKCSSVDDEVPSFTSNSPKVSVVMLPPIPSSNSSIKRSQIGSSQVIRPSKDSINLHGGNKEPLEAVVRNANFSKNALIRSVAEREVKALKSSDKIRPYKVSSPIQTNFLVPIRDKEVQRDITETLKFSRTVKNRERKNVKLFDAFCCGDDSEVPNKKNDYYELFAFPAKLLPQKMHNFAQDNYCNDKRSKRPELQQKIDRNFNIQHSTEKPYNDAESNHQSNSMLSSNYSIHQINTMKPERNCKIKFKNCTKIHVNPNRHRDDRLNESMRNSYYERSPSCHLNLNLCGNPQYCGAKLSCSPLGHMVRDHVQK